MHKRRWLSVTQMSVLALGWPAIRFNAHRYVLVYYRHLWGIHQRLGWSSGNDFGAWIINALGSGFETREDRRWVHVKVGRVEWSREKKLSEAERKCRKRRMWQQVNRIQYQKKSNYRWERKTKTHIWKWEKISNRENKNWSREHKNLFFSPNIFRLPNYYKWNYCSRNIRSP